MSASGSVDVTVDGLVAEYRVWLALERGLASETVRCYGSRAGTFLRWLSEPLESSLPRLDSGRVTSFVLDYCRDHDRGSAQAMVTAVRAVLRFLHLSGRVPRGLAAAVPAVAGWRLASLPRGLDAGVVARLLASCDRSTVGGRRDYAILLLLARLGLRGGEVAGLELGDVDWRGGELTVRGKGGRIDRLPLPVDVGEAIVAYLTDGRPRGPARALFCTVNAPSRRLSAGAVRGVMHSACRRGELTGVGAHRLRHTLATEMLRAGASLPEVGQVLRHRSQLATSIYAKVDDDALRVLARPWPGGER